MRQGAGTGGTELCLRGVGLSQATNSCGVFAGTFGPTAIAEIERADLAIGVRSVNGS